FPVSSFLSLSLEEVSQRSKAFLGFCWFFSVMEKYKCKFCLKRFVNGRALGGHMRSHMANLYVPPSRLVAETESASSSSSSSSSSSEEDENEEKDLLYYELRENPKKSIRLVDSEFSFTVVDAGSVVLQDGESETEYSKNPVRRRSKRIRKSEVSDHHHLHRHHHHHCHDQNLKEPVMKKPKSEPEPVMSSISDTSPEEDVAYCLMMLSRDKWMREEEDDDEKLEPEEEEDDQTEDSGELWRSKGRLRPQYKCETCRKVFRSYQALGGHRANHKKMSRGNNNGGGSADDPPPERGGGCGEEKIHECPVCYRVFSSGQALGGHKRSHLTGSATITTKPPLKSGESFIDLNLPAPIDDDDEGEDEISQIEESAVSDSEFVNPIKQ
ncbi:hypothetical protein U1Q18_023347, partial [Sarracenia purpurea var. burkii]